jgi:ribosomal protein S18 acetylase RimI-like enzyme
MIFEYCPKCGQKLDKKEIGDEGLVPFCIPCNTPWFSFSYPCILCLIVDENDNVVLTRDKANTYYGGVAGFIKESETAENAAKREIEEEVGLIVDDIQFVKSSMARDNLMMTFICRTKNAELKISEKELYAAEWFPVNEAINLVRQGSVIRQLIDEYLQTKNMIKQIKISELERCLYVIRESFATVAKEFDLTEENFPNHTSFIKIDRLQYHWDTGNLMYGYYVKDNIVGYVSLFKKDGAEFVLNNLAVLPEYRHLGYGRELIAHCRDTVKELGGSKITIGIIEENTRLKDWYAENGFVHTGTKKFDGWPFTVGFMEMKI